MFVFMGLFAPGPEPEDQPLLHFDQQHCLTPCREPLLHPSPEHARPDWQQGLRLRFCHQSHLDPGEQRQRDHRWENMNTFPRFCHLECRRVIECCDCIYLMNTNWLNEWVLNSFEPFRRRMGETIEGSQIYMRNSRGSTERWLLPVSRKPGVITHTLTFIVARTTPAV